MKGAPKRGSTRGSVSASVERVCQGILKGMLLLGVDRLMFPPA